MNSVLHYPTIEFQDLEALKRALLVWDRVYRIVPRGYRPRDEPEVGTAVSEGLVQDLQLEPEEKASAAHSFLEFHNLRQRPDTALAWPAGFSSESFTRLNPDKIDARLLPMFEQLSQRLTTDGFYEIPHELAGGYMFYLSTAVASRRSLDLTTTSADYWTVGSFFASGGGYTEQVYADRANDYLVNLAIGDLLPQSLDGVPIDAILRFRQNTAELRREFQTELDALKKELSTCNNKTHALYIFNDFVKNLEFAKKKYRDSMGFIPRGDLGSLLSVGLPVSMSVLSIPAVGGDPYSPIRLGVGLLLGAVSALAHRSRPEATVASYLVDTENLSNAPSYRLHRKFEEFIND